MTRRDQDAASEVRRLAKAIAEGEASLARQQQELEAFALEHGVLGAAHGALCVERHCANSPLGLRNPEDVVSAFLRANGVEPSNVPGSVPHAQRFELAREGRLLDAIRAAEHERNVRSIADNRRRAAAARELAEAEKALEKLISARNSPGGAKSVTNEELEQANERVARWRWATQGWPENMVAHRAALEAKWPMPGDAVAHEQAHGG